MSRFLLHLCGVLALCLSIGLGPLQAQNLSGPKLAGLLNQAYASTPDRCVGGLPAYYCSGVMVKQVLPTDPQPFWTHGPDAVARGAERFDYLRSDIANAGLAQENGYLFFDRFTAIGMQRDYQLLGDDGMNRPPELMVQNWNATAPAQLPLAALYYRRTTAGLAAALRDQRLHFEATGQWLPLVRIDASGSGDRPFGFDLREQLYSGYQVADRLNRRYAETASTCADGRSAIHCNGVFIRGTGCGEEFHSWNPTDNSIWRDGVSFAWIRADNGVKVVYSPGLIFHELGKPMEHAVRFRCAYPANPKRLLQDDRPVHAHRAGQPYRVTGIALPLLPARPELLSRFFLCRLIGGRYDCPGSPVMRCGVAGYNAAGRGTHWPGDGSAA